MTPEELKKHETVQKIAKETIEFLKSFIRVGISEKEIAVVGEKYLKQKNVHSFWYHGISVFVLIGPRTTLSISGREYNPTDIQVQSEDLVTIDLSLEIDNFWGDYARSFVIQNGKVEGIDTRDLTESNSEIMQGMQTEELLHTEFLKVVKEEMTFDEVYKRMDSLIRTHDFINLDFRRNLGHTIEKNIHDRRYFETGNKTTFKNVDLFTFEPHIQKQGGNYGFKREDIYYFNNGSLQVL